MRGGDMRTIPGRNNHREAMATKCGASALHGFFNRHDKAQQLYQKYLLPAESAASAFPARPGGASQIFYLPWASRIEILNE
jgi:hypothetical protein